MVINKKFLISIFSILFLLFIGCQTQDQNKGALGNNKTIKDSNENSNRVQRVNLDKKKELKKIEGIKKTLKLQNKIESDNLKNIEVNQNYDSDCVEYVALWSSGEIAEKIGKDKKWVFLNYTIDVWDIAPSEGSGKVVSKLRASSYAKIIDKTDLDYKIESPVDLIQGWISSEHVKVISWKNPKTRKLCK